MFYLVHEHCNAHGLDIPVVQDYNGVVTSAWNSAYDWCAVGISFMGSITSLSDKYHKDAYNWDCCAVMS
jgi:hypothetical protein